MEKIYLRCTDLSEHTFTNASMKADAVNIFIVDLDKPGITHAFPWANIVELQIPQRVTLERIIKPGG